MILHVLAIVLSLGGIGFGFAGVFAAAAGDGRFSLRCATVGFGFLCCAAVLLNIF